MTLKEKVLLQMQKNLNNLLFLDELSNYMTFVINS